MKGLYLQIVTWTPIGWIILAGLYLLADFLVLAALRRGQDRFHITIIRIPAAIMPVIVQQPTPPATPIPTVTPSTPITHPEGLPIPTEFVNEPTHPINGHPVLADIGEGTEPASTDS